MGVYPGNHCSLDLNNTHLFLIAKLPCTEEGFDDRKLKQFSPNILYLLPFQNSTFRDVAHSVCLDTKVFFLFDSFSYQIYIPSKSNSRIATGAGKYVALSFRSWVWLVKGPKLLNKYFSDAFRSRKYIAAQRLTFCRKPFFFELIPMF